jgi:hypothetical protein
VRLTARRKLRRQLRWLGHVRRMPTTRMPKKLLTAWMPLARLIGRPELAYGQTVLRTVRAVEAGGGFVGPAAVVAAGAAVVAAASTAAVAERTVATAAVALRAAGVELRAAPQLPVVASALVPMAVKQFVPGENPACWMISEWGGKSAAARAWRGRGRGAPPLVVQYFRECRNPPRTRQRHRKKGQGLFVGLFWGRRDMQAQRAPSTKDDNLG